MLYYCTSLLLDETDNEQFFNSDVNVIDNRTTSFLKQIYY
jgi:hypothetical protein